MKTRARWTLKIQSHVGPTSSSMRKKAKPYNFKGLDLELKMKQKYPGIQVFFFSLNLNSPDREEE